VINDTLIVNVHLHLVLTDIDCRKPVNI